ncbi:Surfeit locus 1 family protein [Bosea vaviloviae]|uniref:SURF1-like protein n=1 Tax=Bosea vaviloviae TaxID=1526658 RepID=A0A0N1FHY7_9HYPH|nr:Surfeit locus 1 family protein [Bosea vaviloviae]
MSEQASRKPAAARTPRPLWVLSIACVVALACVAGLAGLGIWQMQRLGWKQALIQRVETRIRAEPVPAPGPAHWGSIGEDEYLRVRLAGRFLHDRETLVQAVTERGGGFWVLTPLVSEAGFTVLVNRGFVPPERRGSRADARPSGPVTLTGLLRLSEPGGGFLRENAPAQDRWYSRDVAATAQTRGLENAAPYFVDADATPNPGGFPVGGLTVLRFANNHLVYALTWFALALMLACAMIFVLRCEYRLRHGTERQH